MKKLKVLSITLLIAISATFPASAGEWKKEKDGRWWYQNDDGTYPANQWQEIDGKEYYFGTEGYMMRNMFAPDDREVGPDGVWTGFVQSYEEREQAFLDVYKPYLESLLFLAQSSNHIGVMTEMEGDAYKDLLSAIPQREYCYPASEGAALKIQANYLYYGNLSEGKAKGSGTAYNTITKDSNTSARRYGYFSGMWDNDAPNGYGVEYFYSNRPGVVTYISGNYINWYQDGDMTTVMNNNNNLIKTYYYKVVDKFPVGIGTAKNSRGNCTVVAYPEENNGGYLTFYDTAQTAANIFIDDGIKKNSYGYWN